MSFKTATLFVLDLSHAVSSRSEQDEYKAAVHYLLHDALADQRKGDHVGILLTNTTTTDNPLVSYPTAGDPYDDRPIGVPVTPPKRPRSEEDEDSDATASICSDTAPMQYPSYHHVTVLQPMVTIQDFDPAQTLFALPEPYTGLPRSRPIDRHFFRFSFSLAQWLTQDHLAVDGLIVAIDMMHAHCRHLKYTKKIYYFTALPDTAKEVASDDDETIADSLREKEIALHLVHFGKGKDQARWQPFLDHVPNSSIEAIDAFLQRVQIPHIRSVRPTPLYSGPLYITPSIAVGPASMIHKTMAKHLPTTIKGDFAAGEDGEGEWRHFRREVTYHSVEGEKEEERREVAGEDVVKSFRFGTTNVPITDMEEQLIVLPTTAGLWVREYLWLADIEHHALLNNVQVLCLDATKVSGDTARLWQNYIHFLLSVTAADVGHPKAHHVGLAAMARYVPKDGKPPQMVLLQPVEEEGQAWFYVSTLPFADDVRSLPLPSLGVGKAVEDRMHRALSAKSGSSPFLDVEVAFWQKVQKQQPASTLQASMDTFVASLSEEKVTPVFNPSILRWRQWMMRSSYKPGQAIPSAVLDQGNTTSTTLTTAPILAAMQKSAPVTKVMKPQDMKVERKAEQPRSVEDLLFLRDDSDLQQRDQEMAQEAQEQQPVRDMIPYPENGIIVKEKPIDSFVDALNKASESEEEMRLEHVFDAMAAFLKAMKSHAVTEEEEAKYNMAFACFKRACIEYDEVDIFDAFCKAV